MHLQTELGLRSTAYGPERYPASYDVPLEILPFKGNRRHFTLKRTSYFICSSEDHRCHIDGSNIALPSTGGQVFQFQLELCYGNTRRSTKDSCYILRSMCEKPFKINGVFAFEAFLEQGDRIQIGYNQIKIPSPCVQVDDASETLLDQQIPDAIVYSPLSILLTGETGTGKSRMAKIIHEQSGRLGSFVHVNLSAFSVNLIESELFGHVKGAFTGANKDKLGALWEAHHGTLFIDEIDSLPWEIQTKLLLFLDSGTVRPVGGVENGRVDVRIIFAAGRKLEQLVDEGKMRKDFFYRITAGATYHLAALRDRPEVIRHIIDQYCYAHGVIFSTSLIDFYQRYAWPGNVRQLLGHLIKKATLSKGKLIEYDEQEDRLLLSGSLPSVSEGPMLTLEQVKHRYIQKVYLHCNGSFAESVKILKIAPNTMRTIMNKVGL